MFFIHPFWGTLSGSTINEETHSDFHDFTANKFNHTAVDMLASGVKVCLKEQPENLSILRNTSIIRYRRQRHRYATRSIVNDDYHFTRYLNLATKAAFPRS